MGDRASVSFRTKGRESVTLCHHWGGEGFFELAKEYVKELKEDMKEDGGGNPLGRLEPNTMMVDFIRFLTKDKSRVMNSLYLGATPQDVDNSDNGHQTIDTEDL